MIVHWLSIHNYHPPTRPGIVHKPAIIQYLMRTRWNKHENHTVLLLFYAHFIRAFTYSTTVPFQQRRLGAFDDHVGAVHVRTHLIQHQSLVFT